MLAVTIPISNPFGPRYYLMGYITFTLIVSMLIIQFIQPKYLKPIFVLLILTSLSGNFWVYPEKISQAWDGSLAHYPYFTTRMELIHYLEENNIDFSDVGSSLYLDITDPQVNKRRFPNIDLEENKWVIYSNIYNSDDEFIDTIKTYQLEKRFSHGALFMDLYKIKDK